MKRTALILGATGLIGQELTQRLIESHQYKQVTVLVRTKMKINHPKLSQVIIDFEELKNYQHFFAVEDVFCCLGTTMKKAKSKVNFLKVDFKYPFIAAQLAVKQNVQNFLIVSALNANPTANLFYPRVKGKLEKALKKLPLRSLHIFRPSLLLGSRDEFRFGEKMAEKILTATPFLFIGNLKKYAPIYGQTVAEAMKNVAIAESSGTHIYPSDKISKLALAN